MLKEHLQNICEDNKAFLTLTINTPTPTPPSPTSNFLQQKESSFTYPQLLLS